MPPKPSMPAKTSTVVEPKSMLMRMSVPTPKSVSSKSIAPPEEKSEEEVAPTEDVEAAAAAAAAEAAEMTPMIAVFEAKGIRIRGTVPKPLLCGVDTAKYVGDDNYRRTFSTYERGVYVEMIETCDAQGKIRQMIYLTEAGLYRYLLQSNSEKAIEFQLFVYNLLTEERKRTVDSVKLALKIAQTELAEKNKTIETARIVRRMERIELNDVMTRANDFREERDAAQKKLKALQTKQRKESMAETKRVEDEENRRRWAPFPYPGDA